MSHYLVLLLCTSAVPKNVAGYYTKHFLMPANGLSTTSQVAGVVDIMDTTKITQPRDRGKVLPKHNINSRHKKVECSLQGFVIASLPQVCCCASLEHT